MTNKKGLVIGVVGPCKSGKTELTKELRKLGYSVKHIAQEHSFAPSMWKKSANPDILIYLDVSFDATLSRSNLDWNEKDYLEQLRRLENAYANANLIVLTDKLTVEEVLDSVLEYLKEL